MCCGQAGQHAWVPSRPCSRRWLFASSAFPPTSPHASGLECRWTTQALMFLPSLLGLGRSGGWLAKAGAAAAQLLPVLVHAAFRAMP